MRHICGIIAIVAIKKNDDIWRGRRKCSNSRETGGPISPSWFSYNPCPVSACDCGGVVRAAVVNDDDFLDCGFSFFIRDPHGLRNISEDFGNGVFFIENWNDNRNFLYGVFLFVELFSIQPPKFVISGLWKLRFLIIHHSKRRDSEIPPTRGWTLMTSTTSQSGFGDPSYKGWTLMTSTTSQSGFGDPSYKRLDVDDIYNFAAGSGTVSSRRWMTVSESTPSASAWKLVKTRWRRTAGATDFTSSQEAL